MQTERGFDRLANFSDAVVAIAITLLVLPLVDSAREFHDGNVAGFLALNADGLFTFALSFVVIGNFWRLQHRLYESLTGYNAALLWATLLWLFSIVFLPFPTELLGAAADSDRGADALYIGTMLLTSIASLLQVWVIRRSLALQAEAARGTVTLAPALMTTTIMAVALVLAVGVPAVGLRSLLLLLLTDPLLRLLHRGSPA
jgi:uncharacterized membrane protein